MQERWGPTRRALLMLAQSHWTSSGHSNGGIGLTQTFYDVIVVVVLSHLAVDNRRLRRRINYFRWQIHPVISRAAGVTSSTMRGRVLLGLVAIEIVYLIGGGFIFWALQNSPVAQKLSGEPATEAPVVNVTLLQLLINDYMGQCLPIMKIIMNLAWTCLNAQWIFRCGTCRVST